MKTGKVFTLVIFFSILIIMSLLVFAEDSKQASDFQSNGDLIEGWYWLRDSALQNYAEWTFDNIPLGPEEITVQINALATDRPSGGGGFDAKFLLYYSRRGEGDIPLTYIPPQTVTLENVSSPEDPLGYSCQGQVTIPASTIPAASRISLKIKRDSAQDNHIAFKEESIVLLTDATHPPYVDPSANDDDFQGATPIQSGTCTGSLGEEDEEGNRDDLDYYSIDLEEGQQITLQLTIPGNAQYGISLLNPNRNSLGSSITQKDIKTLDYVANSTGTWYIKIHRSSGEGEYQLFVDIQDQNDAEKGQDAGDSYQGAITISPPGGTFTGLLKAGDDLDYYSIDLEEGQQITLQLTVPGNASYSISLLNPNHASRGSSITQREIKTLDYVADSTGTWYIRVHRFSGEGEYQLVVDIQDQNDAENGQDAGDSYQGAIPISTGTITGLLKAGDNDDYYSINLEEGQQITLQLTIPGNAQYGILLLNPNRNSLGSSEIITENDTKTLSYVANSSGTWYIKIHRSSGEGEYQLVVNSFTDDSGGGDNNSPVISSLDANQDSVEINHNADITCNANDQDGDTLTFDWTVNGEIEIAEGEPSSLTWNAPNTAGTYTITCTVSDGRGGEDSESVSITVTEPSDDDNNDNGNDNIGEVNYRIEITTGTRVAAGTDANVYITLYDRDGLDSGEILLDNPGVNDFEIGDTNTFLVTAINIEDLDYIIIRHDNSGNYSGWYVDEIQVSNEEINKEWTFLPDQWLATDEPPDYQTQGRFYLEYSFSSFDSHFTTSGGTGEFTVTSPSSDFQWTAESDASWIQIDSGGNGPGNKTLSFSVQNNTSEEERVGHITVENKIHTITQAATIEFNLNLSNQGRTLNSNLPIFVSADEVDPEIDLDGDEINQQWENDAMEFINPNFELDEHENWRLEHPNDHHVVNFVRVFPYPTKDNKRYILFVYCVTWSRDYGRGGITEHNGDVERVIMAWKITEPEGKHLELKKVFTSAHGSETNHSGVWDAWNRTCNIGIVKYWPDETFCASLEFPDQILKLQCSEGKHAIYPTADCCESVTLAAGIGDEDCGGGEAWRFECFNAGEPDHYLIDDLDNPSSWEGLSEAKRSSLTNLFSFEQVWSGRKEHSNKFCGGLEYDSDSPGPIGNKLEGIPEELTNKLTWDMATYQIKVKTSKLGTLPQGEGTDANVYIELFGRKSNANLYTSGEFLLDNSGDDDFQRGETNTFTAIGKEIGELEYITLRHDNSGVGAGWHCDNIVVKNQTTDREWTIPVNAWLEKQGNINPFMTLYPQ